MSEAPVITVPVADHAAAERPHHAGLAAVIAHARDRFSPWVVVACLLVFSFWLGARFGAGLPFGEGAAVQLTTWQLATVSPASPTNNAASKHNVSAPVRHGLPVARRSTSAIAGTVNVNVATIEDLRRVLHVRRATASRIVLYRQQHGPFASIDDLLAMPLSRSTVERIAAHLRFH